MEYIGDYIVGANVFTPFSTNLGTGARANPSDPFQTSDIFIYKNGSATQRTSSAGETIVSPFDSRVGIHWLTLDLSDNTDAGFYAAGNDYTVVLYPNKTVDGEDVSKIIAQFSIENRNGNMTHIGGNSIVGNLATLTLKELHIENSGGDAVTMSSTGNNGSGLKIMGNVGGAGLHMIGGNISPGFLAEGGSSAGSGMVSKAVAGNGIGFDIEGQGTGTGMQIAGGVTSNSIGLLISGRGNLPALKAIGGLTGSGIEAIGGPTSGTGFKSIGGGLGDGMLVQSGNGATGDGLKIESLATNGVGLNLIGKGNGAGMLATGGATGHGIDAEGGATSGNGIKATANGGNTTGFLATGIGTGSGIRGVASGGNGSGISGLGNGSGDGLNVQGGATGHGAEFQGGATSGNGASFVSQGGNGHGILTTGEGSGEGISAKGGLTGHGIHAFGGATSGNGALFEAQAGNSQGLGTQGFGTGAGMLSTGGATGIGIHAEGGATSGSAVKFAAVAGNSVGFDVVGFGSSSGMRVTGGLTGHGLSVGGGATSGIGFKISANGGNSVGMDINGFGTGAGMLATGGDTSGDGIEVVGGGVGNGIYAKSGGGATGDAVRFQTLSINGNGLNITGIGSGAGMLLTAGATGIGFHARGGATSGSGGLFEGRGTNDNGLETIKTGTGIDLSAPIHIGKIWDEILTGATHNIATSAGRRLRELGGIIFAAGTAQSGGNNSIQLASGDVTINGFFDRAKVIITAGTGVGQEAIITNSVASTDTLTVTPAWTTNPDVTSEYQVLPAQAHSTVRNGGYDNGFVYIDTVNGFTGTEQGVNGTSTRPSKTVADAYVIAGVENIIKFSVLPGSTVNLPSDSSFRAFVGTKYFVTLNNQNIEGTTFFGADSITGTGTGGALATQPFFDLCAIGNCTLPPCGGFQLAFFGKITFSSAGSYTFGGSATILNSTATFDYGLSLNASTLHLPSWGGGKVEIENAGAGTGSYLLEINGDGDLTINANCSATTEVIRRGNISLTNNASGITLNDDANSIPATIDALLTTNHDAGSWAGGGISIGDVEGIRHRLNLDGDQTAPTAGGAAKMAGTDADLTLKSIVVSNSAGDAVQYTSTGSNGHGLSITGEGFGHGIDVMGGTTAGMGINVISANNIGARFQGGGGAGIFASSTGGDGSGFKATGEGAGAGIEATGGSTGAGIKGQGGADGAGVEMTGGSSSGNGLTITAQSGNGHGVSITGEGFGDGMSITGGATAGIGIDVISANNMGARFQGGGGAGIFAFSTGGDSGFKATGDGAGAGIEATGGATGSGVIMTGGATSGNGLTILSQGGNSHGLSITGEGFGHGIDVTGGDTGGMGMSVISANNIGFRIQGDSKDISASEIDDIKAKTDNLPHSIKRNTAIPNFKFAMLNLAGDLAASLTITASRKLDADVSYTAMTGTIVDNGSGAYSIDINAADNNGGAGVWRFVAPGAKTTLITFLTEAV